jgi:hypothetical protein
VPEKDDKKEEKKEKEKRGVSEVKEDKFYTE